MALVVEPRDCCSAGLLPTGPNINNDVLLLEHSLVLKAHRHVLTGATATQLPFRERQSVNMNCAWKSGKAVVVPSVSSEAKRSERLLVDNNNLCVAGASVTLSRSGGGTRAPNTTGF